MGPEARIEQTVCKFAKEHGFSVEKVNVVNARGRPDRRFSQKGHYFFIEFKAPGEKPTELQKFRHDEMREQGETVYVVDSAITGRATIRAELMKIRHFEAMNVA
ncbi:MAG: VRR-NUC domain-containing protein [Pseudomonadota bacterium]